MKAAPLLLAPTPDATKTFQQRFTELFNMVEYANGRGYEAVWFAEHHFSDYGFTPNPLQLLGKAAEIAPDLRLATGVLVVPLWHPIRLAEDIATLDVLSNGRVDVGIGRGYQRSEFESLGVELDDNRQMLDEALDIMKAAWTQDEVEYHGKFWNVPSTSVFPRPVQEPTPPIWMAATSPGSIRSAVERGYHICTGTGALLDELAQRNAFLDRVFEELGRSSEGIERSINKFVLCTNNPDEVQEAITHTRFQLRASKGLAGAPHPKNGRGMALYQHATAEEPSDEDWLQRLIVGTPEQCIDRIKEHAEVGITYINCLFEYGGLDYDVALRSMKLFTDEVVPALPSIKTIPSDESERMRAAREFVERGDYAVGI